MHLLAKQLLTYQLISYLGEPKVAIIKIRVKWFALFPYPLWSVIKYGTLPNAPVAKLTCCFYFHTGIAWWWRSSAINAWISYFWMVCRRRNGSTLCGVKLLTAYILPVCFAFCFLFCRIYPHNFKWTKSPAWWQGLVGFYLPSDGLDFTESSTSKPHSPIRFGFLE